MLTTENENSVEKLLHRLEDYVVTSVELFQIKAANKMAGVASAIAAKAITFLILILTVIILSIGLSLWLGDLLGKLYYGFFAVGGFYALVGILFFGFGEGWLKNSIGNSFSEHILNDNEHG